jgi:hypothetical protein
VAPVFLDFYCATSSTLSTGVHSTMGFTLVPSTLESIPDVLRFSAFILMSTQTYQTMWG